jgi:simple sugar transport system permease protein
MIERLAFRLLRSSAVTAAALVAAWLAFDLLVIAFGDSPRELLSLLVRGTWGTPYGVGQVLYKATPLLFSGVGVAIALRAGLFNIGAEGQMAVAALVTALAGAKLGSAPHWLAIGVVVLASAVGGALWAAPAAALRARFGVHEVISTILLNRIADSGVTFLLAAGLAVPASVRTPDIARPAELARLEHFWPWFQGSAVSTALFFALVVAALAALAGRWTRVGRELGLVAGGPEACAAEHIPVARRRLQALIVSGAVCGLASSATVLGFKGAYEQGLGAGAGFAGIAVALLGRGNFFGVVLAALLFGTLEQGGLVLNARVPMELMDVLQALVIVAVAAFDRNARALVTLRKQAEVAP